MKFNKAFLALYGGITLGFFVLGILYIFLGKGKVSNNDVAIIFSVISMLFASFVVLYETKRKRSGKGKQCTSENVTYYVP